MVIAAASPHCVCVFYPDPSEGWEPSILKLLIKITPRIQCESKHKHHIQITVLGNDANE